MAAESVVPLIGLTGGMGAGKSTALAALERLGAAVLSTDAVVHELYAGDAAARSGAWSAGVRRWRRRVSSTARPWRGGRSRTGEERAGSRDAVADGWRAGRGLARAGARATAPAGAGRGGAAAVRGWHGGAVRRDDRGRRETSRCAASARRAGACLGRASARRGSYRQEEKAQRATFVIRNDGSEGELVEKLSAILVKLGG